MAISGTGYVPVVVNLHSTMEYLLYKNLICKKKTKFNFIQRIYINNGRPEYLKIFPRISCVYLPLITWKYVAKNVQKPILGTFLGVIGVP